MTMFRPPNEPAQGGPGTASCPLADPLSEARRLVTRAEEQGVSARLLGGAAICLQAPEGRPLLPRTINDIDLVTPGGASRGVAKLLEPCGYVSNEMFNALHGAKRQIYLDPVNNRKLDVFVGGFSMCHPIPIAERLNREPVTVPLAELLLTKLQIVQLNERDERDIYNLCYHHPIDGPGATGIESELIAGLCARDWGLWRTCKQTIERCQADLGTYELATEARELIAVRLAQLWERVEATPKTRAWRMRNRVGDRVRWFEEPEEVEGRA
jgi:hypothetical protein